MGATKHRNSSGQVRVYYYHIATNTWKRRGQDIDGEASGDMFGFSVSLSDSGDVLAAGSKSSDGGGTDSGSLRVYQYYASSNTWQKIGESIYGESAYDEFGHSTDISADGNFVVAGGRKNDNVAGQDSGHVRVFSRKDSNTWTQVGREIVGESGGDFFGRSVSLSSDGTVLAAGGIWNDGNGVDSGHVRVYKLCQTVSIHNIITDEFDYCHNFHD